MKPKVLILLMAVAATFICQVLAQENGSPVIREVERKIYNINRSALWKTVKGDCVKVLTNGIVIETFTMKPVYEATTTSREIHNYWGGIKGYRTVPTQIQVGTEKDPGIQYILRNYPFEFYPAVGQTITCRAMRVGTSDYAGDILELWDCGTSPTQDELKTLQAETDAQQKAAEKEQAEQRRVAAKNAVAAKKAALAKIVKWNQAQADKGDPAGLLRMGELYRDGAGVPKDVDKARDYFSKAAAAGSPSAADKLLRLNQISTNPPVKSQ